MDLDGLEMIVKSEDVEKSQYRNGPLFGEVKALVTARSNNRTWKDKERKLARSLGKISQSENET